MLCANPECLSTLFDQPGGSLWLMELEVKHDPAKSGEDNGFPVCTLPTKYFWLCVDCTERYVLSRWTLSGVVLKPRRPGVIHGLAMRKRTEESKPPVRIYASLGLESAVEEAV